ncbi:hypothetical protein [Mycobacterium intracellulare]|uniref:hypothetical protein n=1 Tax=Mycobacterium intracellulare TaxID=1767 RepID=UPI0025953B48|nr:hypothetical protein [Mycobacterium intracellulare]MDM3894798.1 hypothetical protein [Mycobacterium intracellulare]
MSHSRFPAFDYDRKPVWDVIDGVPTICNERDVLADLTVLEPLDERNDSFAAIPVRSVITAGGGPSIELGPFSLDTSEVIKLYNALAAHINSFSGEFRFKGQSA